MNYTIELRNEWDKYYKKFSSEMQERIFKKITELEKGISCRRLKRKNYFVAEVGQYRIVFLKNEEAKVITIAFIGNHKQYEKFLGIRK